MMDENKKAAQKKKSQPFYYNSSAGYPVSGIYLPVYHGNFQCV